MGSVSYQRTAFVRFIVMADSVRWPSQSYGSIFITKYTSRSLLEGDRSVLAVFVY